MPLSRSACSVAFKNLTHRSSKGLANIYAWNLAPSPPAEKAAARQDQAGQASAGDGAGNRGLLPMYGGDFSLQPDYVIALATQAVDNKIDGRSWT